MDKLQNNVPRVRFKWYQIGWEQKLISDVFSIRNENSNASLFSVDIELENMVSNIGIIVGNTSIRTKSKSTFRKNDILFGKLRPYLNKWWLSDCDGVKSGEIWALYTIPSKFNCLFSYCLIQTFNFLNIVNLTTGTKMPRADWSLVKENVISTPQLKEQIQIGNLFQKLDKLIELSQTRLEQTKTYKKAMLQKMFPQQGESVPEIRFKGFSGDWITDQLGKIAKIYRGLTYSPSDITISGLGTRVLRSSNISEDVLVLKENDIFVNSSAVKLENIQCEDILITAANGSTNLVGKHAIIKSELKDTVHGGFMLVLRTKRSFFINAWMSTSEYKRMLQLVQGGNGAIGNLSKPMLERCKLQYPFSEAEQTKIGNFFQTLDQRIEHQTRKLEHYQQLKKAMLQRMFV